MVAGTAAITAGGLIGGLMIGGGALTAIGAITGSKKAQKWGGILSLAGGVAGLATGAWSAASSTLAEQTATESFRAAELAAQAGEGMQGMVGASGLGSLPDSASMATQALGDVAQPAADAIVAAPAVNSQALTNSIAGATQPAIPVNGPSAMPPGGGAAAPSGMLQSMGDTLKSGVDWATKNQANARITQAGAGLLQAGLGAYGQQAAVKEQIKLQEDAQLRARQRLNDSIKGVRVPVYQPKG